MKLFRNLTSKNTALLVIDVNNGCAHKACEDKKRKITFSKIRRMIPSLKSFIEQYRKTINNKVIFVKTTPWKKKFLPSNINELYEDSNACYYSKDSSGFAEEFYKVQPQEEDLVIEKNSYSAFSNKKLTDYLKNKGIKYLVVVGIFSDGCVLSSVAEGFSKGHSFIICEDLVQARDDKANQQLHKLLLQRTYPYMYGRVLNSKDFFREWENSKF